jgi:hypothetical protein
MNRTKQSKWVAVLCVAALAGCASDNWSDGSSRDANTGYTAPSGTGASTSGSGSSIGSSTSSGSMGSTAGSMGATSDSATAQASYGTVQAIDQMQRQDVGVGAIGAAAAGGAMTGSPTDRVYRVTVRMEDGSSQLIVVDSMPSFKIGDRVRYSNGTLNSY